MSTYILMKILESAPRRYDFGIRVLTLGGVGKAYDRLASHVRQGQRILDIGCGTGALTLRAARNGAQVKGIDVSAAMLEVAEQRVREAGLSENVAFREMGVAALDGEESAGYDVAMSGLCFSELSEDELAYTLGQVRRILKPGGLLLVGDEVRPRTMTKRLIRTLVRTPLAAFTYVACQQTTHPIRDLPEKIAEAGLSVELLRWGAVGSFLELVARKPAEELR